MDVTVPIDLGAAIAEGWVSAPTAPPGLRPRARFTASLPSGVVLAEDRDE